MDRETALRKIRACLRLAGSSNPNEAAAALRQARVLMEQFGVDEHDAAAAEIGDCVAPTRFRGGLLPKSILMLAHLVASGYRCSFVQVRELGVPEIGLAGKTKLQFFGAGADPEVAVYAFTVLRRQLDADRRKHTSRIRKPANRERRGEEFARGWLIAVQALFPSAEMPEGRELAIARAVATRLGETTTVAGKELRKGRSSENDRVAGFIAGSGARLNQGIACEGQRRLGAA